MGARKLTTQEWIIKATAVHGCTYAYEKAVYIGADDRLVITCRKHGDFAQAGSTHLSGKGCPKCGDARSGVLKTQAAKDSFVRKSNKVHTDKFTYLLDTYVNSKTKMSIVCPSHGEFYQRPSDHLKGLGCFKCAREKTGDSLRKSPAQYIKDCKDVHGDKYDYSETKYRATNQHVDITCRLHGVFTQLAISHLLGKGCPSCAKAGYKTTSPGSLYVLTVDNITKVGITNNAPRYRCYQICADSGMSFSILKAYYFEDGRVPNNLETYLLRWLRKTYTQLTTRFSGFSECFYDVDRDKLLEQIEYLTTEQHSSKLAAQAA